MADIDKIERIFASTLEQPADQREAYLRSECGEDKELLEKLRELLFYASEEYSGFLSSPALVDEAKKIAKEAWTLQGGDEFGPYKILHLLGGGMGLVYKGVESGRERAVALKTLLPELGTAPNRIRRFHREAKSLKALSHKAIPEIYEIGEKEGIHFIAMEWIDGQTLAERLQQEGSLEPDEIIDLALQITEGLDAAHRKGLIHRDIKPSNLMITAGSQVKILDFGLVKSHKEFLPDMSTDSLTAEGTVVGTVDYMSPEQILNKELDPRSDIFSLGVVMYEMATGRVPYRGRTVTETMDKILHTAPIPIARYSRQASDELEAIVRKCLAKEREKRYQSAEELGHVLRGDAERSRESLFSKVRRLLAGRLR